MGRVGNSSASDTAHAAQNLNRQHKTNHPHDDPTEGHEAAVGGEAVDVLAPQLRRRDRGPAALGRPREGAPELPQLLEEGGRDGQVRVVPEPHREDRVYPLGLRGQEEIKHVVVCASFDLLISRTLLFRNLHERRRIPSC